MKHIILIGGPTGSGKSLVAMKLAKKLESLGGSLIINSDSMQVYKDFEILTASPKAIDYMSYDHKLYGFISSSERFSVYHWLEYAKAAINNAWNNGACPIVVGGSGLYFNAIQYGISEIPPIDVITRRRGKKILGSGGLKQLYDELFELDPIGVKQINKNDSQRVLRSWEVIKSSGLSINHWQNTTPRNLIKANFHGFCLMPDRDKLYRLLNDRFISMIDEGAIYEVEEFIKKSIDSSLPINRVVGLGELESYINGNINREVAIDSAQQATRRLAKRQFTWFRNQMTNWEHLDQDLETIVNRIFSYICKIVLTVEI